MWLSVCAREAATERRSERLTPPFLASDQCAAASYGRVIFGAWCRLDAPCWRASSVTKCYVSVPGVEVAVEGSKVVTVARAERGSTGAVWRRGERVRGRFCLVDRGEGVAGDMAPVRGVESAFGEVSRNEENHVFWRQRARAECGRKGCGAK